VRRLSALLSLTDAALSELSRLSLHDALPIWVRQREIRVLTDHRLAVFGDHRHHVHVEGPGGVAVGRVADPAGGAFQVTRPRQPRSEEHTSELQSRENLVCRLLLEKKKTKEKS